MYNGGDTGVQKANSLLDTSAGWKSRDVGDTVSLKDILSPDVIEHEKRQRAGDAGLYRPGDVDASAIASLPDL